MEKLWAAVIILTLAWAIPCTNAQAAPEGKIAARDSEFLWKSTASLTLQDVLSQFELFDRDLRTLSAHFTQSMSMAQTGMASSVEGTVAYLKPDHLLIKHVRPEAQTIVSDGRELWIHRPSRSQAIESSLADWKQADPMLNSLMQFGNYSTMVKSYDVSLDASSSAPILVLRPKVRNGGEADFILRLTLSPTTLFPESTELSVGGMRILTRFDSVEFNPAIDASSFKFTPPAGADVFRDFKPPKFKP